MIIIFLFLDLVDIRLRNRLNLIIRPFVLFGFLIWLTSFPDLPLAFLLSGFLLFFSLRAHSISNILELLLIMTILFKANNISNINKASNFNVLISNIWMFYNVDTVEIVLNILITIGKINRILTYNISIILNKITV